MLPVLLTLLVLMSTDWACAQKNDSISQVPSSNSQRQTLRDKWTAYAVGTFGPRVLFEPIFPATYWMASPPDHYPREWRQGAQGFARNYAAELASQVAFKTARAGAGALLHEDLRCHRAVARNPLLRTGHALAYGFVDRSDSGRPRIALANFVGVGAAGYSGRLYLPAGFNDVSHADTRLAIRFGLLEVNHVLAEFAPEFEHLGEKVHLKYRRLIPEWWTSANK
ncbi:MAG TPA: hypothetical protein VK752_28090 [Bryobacteraceae bacterium]|nr:hypothetical protein [Bryobacteraceae bacterium]